MPVGISLHAVKHLNRGGTLKSRSSLYSSQTEISGDILSPGCAKSARLSVIIIAMATCPILYQQLTWFQTAQTCSGNDTCFSPLSQSSQSPRQPVASLAELVWVPQLQPGIIMAPKRNLIMNNTYFYLFPYFWLGHKGFASYKKAPLYLTEVLSHYWGPGSLMLVDFCYYSLRFGGENTQKN